MDRRGFIKLFSGAAGAVVASATMAEAGMLSEVMSWLRRAPAWSFPARIVVDPEQLLFDQFSAATLKTLQKDVLYDNFFVGSPILNKLRTSGLLDPWL